MTSLVWRRLGTRSSDENCQEIQTTSSLANIMFGLRFLASPEIGTVHGELKLILSVRDCFSMSAFPNGVETVLTDHVLPRCIWSSLCSVGCLRSDRTGECIDLHRRGSNPARIPTSLCYEFKKRVYVFYKKAAFASVWIILRDFVLIYFLNF